MFCLPKVRTNYYHRACVCTNYIRNVHQLH